MFMWDSKPCGDDVSKETFSSTEKDEMLITNIVLWNKVGLMLDNIYRYIKNKACMFSCALLLHF